VRAAHDVSSLSGEKPHSPQGVKHTQELNGEPNENKWIRQVEETQPREKVQIKTKAFRQENVLVRPKKKKKLLLSAAPYSSEYSTRTKFF
jgi:hypothetical protein